MSENYIVINGKRAEKWRYIKLGICKISGKGDING